MLVTEYEKKLELVLEENIKLNKILESQIEHNLQYKELEKNIE